MFADLRLVRERVERCLNVFGARGRLPAAAMAQPRPKCCAKVVPILTAISHSAAPEAQRNESSEGESKQAPQGRCRRGIVQEAQGKDYRTSFTSGSVVFGL